MDCKCVGSPPAYFDDFATAPPLKQCALAVES
ncbi:uncharacterized protein Dere_GG26156 [Drosophila erecta]|uniref:Uncharacterized protein n=1 Tax=Drosophila erecta TaxID=7220 RepID=A0A0Q5VZD1_DROER|nr:uncharacterized protein Dere_GG26156 [Drosophila erecta]